VGKCNKVKENVCWMYSHTLIMTVIINITLKRQYDTAEQIWSQVDLVFIGKNCYNFLRQKKKNNTW